MASTPIALVHTGQRIYNDILDETDTLIAQDGGVLLVLRRQRLRIQNGRRSSPHVAQA